MMDQADKRWLRMAIAEGVLSALREHAKDEEKKRQDVISRQLEASIESWKLHMQNVDDNFTWRME